MKLKTSARGGSAFGGKNLKRGFTLLETLVALSVLTSAILGPLSLAAYSIRSAGSSQNQFTAFYLAQEAMEYVRNRRDSNALQNKSNWLDGLVPFAGAICENENGCYIDPTLSDSNPSSITSCQTSGCPKLRYNAAAGIYSYNSADPETIFTSKVKLTWVSAYEEKIEVTISWQDRGVFRSFTFEEDILDWQ